MKMLNIQDESEHPCLTPSCLVLTLSFPTYTIVSWFLLNSFNYFPILKSTPMFYLPITLPSAFPIYFVKCLF